MTFLDENCDLFHCFEKEVLLDLGLTSNIFEPLAGLPEAAALFFCIVALYLARNKTGKLSYNSCTSEYSRQ